ncbi:hypothetical protein Q8A64_15460 [Oxalobacteraceae bacterium R-40]|uniref:Uncharacterized protein n=1 Tax=Keguizhuia sedimenti TaxID=3064264 RepID=A0ABU1BS10_9BURK|nr:hypothetical protein [Oxalobacteraceae bacterium R-40]
MNKTDNASLIERLKILEYSIRKTITVREDQDEDVDSLHRDEAAQCGLPISGLTTKGDLLNAVQTAVRSAEAKAGKSGRGA